MRQFTLSLDSATPSSASPEAAENIVNGLNPAQQEAARATDGAVLIIAGPGSGKTRTLTHRIAYLLAANKARPYQILALTFTNKAAREMRERVTRLIGPEAAKGMWMGTFHSIFARVLRTEGEKLGYSKDFTIYDSDDSERILREQMARYSIAPKQFTPRSLRGLISSAKNQMVSPPQYQKLAATPAQERAALIYGPYQEALRRANAMDFDDLLIKPIELFDQHPDALEKYQDRWRYIHIDEYQDTNHAQYLLAKKLAAKHGNFCVVGDDAQSIYAFRGADIGNILSFQRDYPKATTVRLEQNYRSTKKILQLADSIIKQNKDQLDKSLWTDNREGDYVVLSEALSERDEAQKIERTIRDLHVRGGYAYKQFAILYRTNAQSRSLEDALRRGGIPYRIVGGMSFYQRKEIKDVLAYLRLTVNPNDTAGLRRVINYPTRGIGGKTLERITAFARDERITMWQALERIEDVGLSSRARTAVEKFHFLIAKYAAQSASRPADELAREMIQETGILSDLRKENTNESLARWENIQELISAIAEFTSSNVDATLSTFLQEVSLATDADQGDPAGENKVTLMTMHASKGLEFPVVFVSGLEEGLFPLAKAAQDVKELEEERRLFYVGVTRAEERLFLTHARSRFRYGKQESSIRSRFLDEVNPDVIRMESGAKYQTKTGRFSSSGGGSSFSYDNTDPHYYRKSLSGQGKKKTGRKTTRTVARPKPSPAPQGRRVVYDEGEGGALAPGMVVEHPNFGEGKILSLDGRGDQANVVVFFRNAGQKKLKLRFAKLRRIG
ncbi:MAG: UvrD-helicase domain-containing protein [Bacteroidota bacterium]